MAFLFSLEEAKALLEDPLSCFSCVANTKRIVLPNYFVDEFRQGAKQFLNLGLKKFSETLDGILITYFGTKIVSQNAAILSELPYFSFDVRANFIVFRPHVGSVLKGVVNKLSPEHIGCLVHGHFNASIFKKQEEDWNCPNVDVGSTVVFEVTTLDLYSKIIFIRGKLLRVENPETQEIYEAVGDVAATPDPKLKLKFDSVFEDDDSSPANSQEIVHLDADEGAKKSSKKRARSKETNELEKDSSAKRHKRKSLLPTNIPYNILLSDSDNAAMSKMENHGSSNRDDKDPESSSPKKKSKSSEITSPKKHAKDKKKKHLKDGSQHSNETVENERDNNKAKSDSDATVSGLSPAKDAAPKTKILKKAKGKKRKRDTESEADQPPEKITKKAGLSMKSSSNRDGVAIAVDKIAALNDKKAGSSSDFIGDSDDLPAPTAKKAKKVKLSMKSSSSPDKMLFSMDKKGASIDKKVTSSGSNDLSAPAAKKAKLSMKSSSSPDKILLAMDKKGASIDKKVTSSGSDDLSAMATKKAKKGSKKSASPVKKAESTIKAATASDSNRGSDNDFDSQSSKTTKAGLSMKSSSSPDKMLFAIDKKSASIDRKVVSSGSNEPSAMATTKARKRSKKSASPDKKAESTMKAATASDSNRGSDSDFDSRPSKTTKAGLSMKNSSSPYKVAIATDKIAALNDKKVASSDTNVSPAMTAAKKVKKVGKKAASSDKKETSRDSDKDVNGSPTKSKKSIGERAGGSPMTNLERVLEDVARGRGVVASRDSDGASNIGSNADFDVPSSEISKSGGKNTGSPAKTPKRAKNSRAATSKLASAEGPKTLDDLDMTAQEAMEISRIFEEVELDVAKFGVRKLGDSSDSKRKKHEDKKDKRKKDEDKKKEKEKDREKKKEKQKDRKRQKKDKDKKERDKDKKEKDKDRKKEKKDEDKKKKEEDKEKRKRKKSRDRKSSSESPEKRKSDKKRRKKPSDDEKPKKKRGKSKTSKE